MNSRQRVLTALDHRQPDRVPVDLGATAVTGMHCSIVAALRDHYQLERRPVKLCEPYQMLGLVEDDLQRAIGVDAEGIFRGNTIFGFPAEEFKPWFAPWGQDLLVPELFNTTTGGDGSIYLYPQGDTSIPPSGQMPAGGYFFDAIVRQEPIDEDRLDVRDNLEEFGPLDAGLLERIVDGVKAAAKTGRAVVLWTPGTALGDIALVPATFLKHPKGIRSVEEWYLSIAMRPKYIESIFRKQVEIALANLAAINDACGNLIDVAFTCGTDFGTQNSQFCSVATFGALWLEHYRAINDWIHAHTKWKTGKHSCGAVAPFIDSFIEAGFDILNPVQCSAAGMEERALKERFGQRITFWGGGVDTQRVLPFGTPEQVRRQVRQRLEIFSPHGGFVFNAIHNVQARTPIENVVAMIEAVRQFNGAAR